MGNKETSNGRAHRKSKPKRLHVRELVDAERENELPLGGGGRNAGPRVEMIDPHPPVRSSIGAHSIGRSHRGKGKLSIH